MTEGNEHRDKAAVTGFTGSSGAVRWSGYLGTESQTAPPTPLRWSDPHSDYVWGV